MRSDNLILYAPKLAYVGRSVHAPDGDLLSLAACFRSMGEAPFCIDEYGQAPSRPAGALIEHLRFVRGASVAVVHLDSTDSYGEPLRRFAIGLCGLRKATPGLTILAYGPIAVASFQDLLASKAVDSVVAMDHEYSAPGARLPPQAAKAVSAIRQHLASCASLRWLRPDEIWGSPQSTFSVRGSRGCRRRCSFCAYNADSSGQWLPRDIAALVDDIAFLHEAVGAKRFSIIDSDFGGDRRSCANRAIALRDHIRARGLHGHVQLSANVISDYVSRLALEALSDAGVRTVVLGLESLVPKVRQEVFRKRVDLDHLGCLLRWSDDVGVVTLASYILWHPWQTVTVLRRELEMLSDFGAHRIPQFLTRSVLRILPGTAIERQVDSDHLLRRGPFQRDFLFADSAVAALLGRATAWYEREVTPVLRNPNMSQTEYAEGIARLRRAEFTWLRDNARMI